MSRRRLNVQAPVHDLIAARWSTRAFDAGRPVEADKLAACLEAARWAPSCYNDQPWRFLVTDRFHDRAPWERLLACLSPGNRAWACRAPVLLLACAAGSFGRDGRPNRWGAYDTGQAVMSLCLQATALALATHQMGGFDADRVREAFAVPADFEPMSVIALGYPTAVETLGDEGLVQREQTPRQRKPLADVAFRDAWGGGFIPPDRLGWEARYRETPVEALPWYCPDLDRDVEKVLGRLGRRRGRILDLGTGPGTQAIALARRGFQVTAIDVSATAVEQARRRAVREGVEVRFLVDDIRDTRLGETFDLILDRGLFHVLAPEERHRYLEALKRLLPAGGYLLLKCFSAKETRPEGPPHRYRPEDIGRIFGPDFTVVDLWESAFHRPGDTDPPKALFAILKKEVR